MDLSWWIAAFELPAMGGLFWLIWNARRDGLKDIDRLQEILETRCNQLREGLNAFKLEVAKNYASQNDLRALEDRLTSHLLRIESKLDATALKTEAVHAKNQT